MAGATQHSVIPMGTISDVCFCEGGGGLKHLGAGDVMVRDLGDQLERGI